MAVRVGWILTGVALLAVWIVGLLGSRGKPNDSEVNGLAMFVIWYGGIALAVIWLAVLVAVGVVKALRLRRDG
jgi:hypothetical protein